MKAEDIGDHAQRVTMRMVESHDPAPTMMKIILAYGKDDSVTGNDMLRIFAASTVDIAHMLDSTTARSIGVVSQLLAMLYADKSPRELAIMASGLLAGVSTEETEAAVRVVLVRRHE